MVEDFIATVGKTDNNDSYYNILSTHSVRRRNEHEER